MEQSDYTATIGLEIHAELRTQSKMFCGSKNDPDETRPNVNVCPVCMAHPGTLPVINKEAVRHVLRVGAAVGGTIADFTEFDRKNYFYPDIPKGYQISQYKYPLVSGGLLRDVHLTRIHLEEDTARSTHEGKAGASLVDFNRAGVPLMELVTEPVIKDSKQAGDFARELQLLLRYLGASEANMEKGEMRVEANVSVSKDAKKFGTKVEVKNLNSFRAVERAIEFEIVRQIEVLEKGGEVTQETRGWNESNGTTFSQRKKESSHDYRYFPDPDLPKLTLSEIAEFQNLSETLPELPWVRRERLHALGLKLDAVEFFVRDKTVGGFFEKVAEHLGDKEKVLLASNYISSDLVGLAGDSLADFTIEPLEFSELIDMVSAGELSSRAAKDILAVLWSEGGSPRAIAEAKGLLQKNNAEELEATVQQIVDAHPAVVAEYKAGKQQSLQFLIGQGMKVTKGAANPKILGDLFKKVLG